MNQTITLAIHGGAGTLSKTDLTPVLETAYRQGLQLALDAGYAILEKGGLALDAVIAATVALENCPLFNAGKGSVFTNTGAHEMDAALMNGPDRCAGAVAGVQQVKNPILLAQQIMSHSHHVFLSGQGALDFALQQGLAIENEDYFFNQLRYNQWQQVKDSEMAVLDHNQQQIDNLADPEKKFGTVGAVACDVQGNIAAATSTGGMTNKRFGRIGDSPVIGSGTYANNDTCAISCTGHGEPFIRSVVAYDVSCLMEYKGYTLQQAAEEVVLKKLVAIEGEGGLIGVDAAGNASLVFNSTGMYRGLRNNRCTNLTSIYAD
jgi:L-asparaginase / beta-aspartyl-peptidase